MTMLLQGNAIQDVNLESVISDLMDPIKGPGWTREQAEAACMQYKAFLGRHLEDPDDDTNPTMEVDMVWHYHILRTRQYHEDCDMIFGYYLHHQPDKPVPAELLAESTDLFATCGTGGGQSGAGGGGRTQPRARYATCGTGGGQSGAGGGGRIQPRAQYATCGTGGGQSGAGGGGSPPVAEHTFSANQPGRGYDGSKPHMSPA